TRAHADSEACGKATRFARRAEAAPRGRAGPGRRTPCAPSRSPRGCRAGLPKGCRAGAPGVGPGARASLLVAAELREDGEILERRRVARRVAAGRDVL